MLPRQGRFSGLLGLLSSFRATREGRGMLRSEKFESSWLLLSHLSESWCDGGCEGYDDGCDGGLGPSSPCSRTAAADDDAAWHSAESPQSANACSLSAAAGVLSGAAVDAGPLLTPRLFLYEFESSSLASLIAVPWRYSWDAGEQ